LLLQFSLRKRKQNTNFSYTWKAGNPGAQYFPWAPSWHRSGRTRGWQLRARCTARSTFTTNITRH